MEKQIFDIKEIVDTVSNHLEKYTISESKTTETKLKMIEDALAYSHDFIEANVNRFGDLDKLDKTIVFRTYAAKSDIENRRKDFKDELVRNDQETNLVTEVDHETKDIKFKDDLKQPNAINTLVKAIGNGISTLETYDYYKDRMKKTSDLFNFQGVAAERLIRLGMLTRRYELICKKLTAISVYNRHGFSDFSEEVLKDQDPNEVDPFNKNFVFDLIIDMAYSNLDSLKIMETASSIKLIFEGNEKELELIKDTLGEMVIGKDSNLFKDTEDYLKTCSQYYVDQLHKLTYDMINDDLIVFDYSNYPNLGNPTVTACEKHSHECNCGHCGHDHHH